ncbi:ABC transporter substrate-binding protein [Salipiger bermudensis]|uniref:ABC transporter substrate-binding protein n=1 Tax=Salipiger bermudensis TaxID=344736 RepID=UPI001CD331D0|nr:ABC transporter substrate-binding protein [Salipiger bermudensis]MCA0962528.1 ABC transporter substrate-binding protein [Salipiger bermudensis]
MSKLSSLLPGAAALVLLPASAMAEQVTLDVLYNLPGFTRFHQPIAEAFMEQHPDIKIEFRAPAVAYNEGHQQVLRSAVTGDMPDVFFSGYHLLQELVETLEPRGQITPIAQFVEQEDSGWVDENYSPKMYALGKIGDTQWGLPVNASSPIMYVNADLVREAGGDPENMPDTWPELLDLAVEINALGDDIAGMAYDIGGWPDDWLWQAMVYQQGGELIDAETGKVAFDNEVGLNALNYFRSFVTEAGQPVLDWDQSRQQFGAGKTGLIFSTPAHVQTVEELVGDRFELVTDTFPLDDKENGGVPTGGNAAVMLTQDEAKQDAAWEYLKWVTGPEAQDMIVRITGYLPTNKRATGEEFLAPFYAENPNVETASFQADRSQPWAGYPGGDSVRIWRTQRDIIAAVMRGETTPEDGLAQLVSETNALME